MSKLVAVLLGSCAFGQGRHQGGVLKKLCIVLACLAIPLQLGAGAQSPQPSLLAYDFCGPYAGPGGWEMWCEIRVSNGDSAAISPIPIALMRGVEPAWSPDGLRIAVVDYDVYLYNLTDGRLVNLTNRSALYGPPRWSPDNARIAFWSDRDGPMELYVVSANGSALTRLTDNVGVRGAFAWSPDGTAMVFAATVGGVPELFVMDADGSNKRRLTYSVGFDSHTHTVSLVEASASWSSDGTRIVFDCGNDICSINADGTNFTRLTTDAVAAFGAVFSPVDGRIAFTTGRFGTLEVAILEENGAVTRVTPGLLTEQHAWSPGGDSLAFVHLRRGGCFDADGSCVVGQWDMVHTVRSDGSGLTAIGEGHHPRFAASLPGQPAASFTYDCTSTACLFDATGSFDPNGYIASYGWDFGDGTTGVGAAPAHQYPTAGHYTVKLVVTDNGGAQRVTLVNILANELPIASFTVACSGPLCTFDGSASFDPDGTIRTYTWVFGDGSYGSGSTATHAYATGTFSATLYVSDHAGYAGGQTQTLTVVNAVPVASFTVVCAALTCTYDASASSDADGSISYAWEFGDGARASSTVATHTYLAGGTYLATLTVVDDVGQAATASRTVTVLGPPPPPATLTLHVGDLDGSSTTLSKTWSAFVTIDVHGESHQRVGGVKVSGTWNDGAKAACTTDSSGKCVLTRHGLANKTPAVTFGVVSAAYATRVYAPAGNHDPDGESNGTSIMVRR